MEVSRNDVFLFGLGFVIVVIVVSGLFLLGSSQPTQDEVNSVTLSSESSYTIVNVSTSQNITVDASEKVTLTDKYPGYYVIMKSNSGEPTRVGQVIFQESAENKTVIVIQECEFLHNSSCPVDSKVEVTNITKENSSRVIVQED